MSHNQFTELDKRIIGKRTIINIAGLIEDYFKAILLKITPAENQNEIYQNLKRKGLRGKEILVLNKLQIKTVLEELQLRDLPFFKNYEKFSDQRNLVHTSDNPDIDPEVQIFTDQLMEDVLRQLDEQNLGLLTPMVKKIFEKLLPVVTLVFYYHYHTIPYMVIIDHCFNCWLSQIHI